MSKRVLLDISLISIIVLYIVFYLDEHGVFITTPLLYVAWGLSTATFVAYFAIKLRTKNYEHFALKAVVVLICTLLTITVSIGSKGFSDYLTTKADHILKMNNHIEGEIYFEDPADKTKPYITGIKELGNLRALGYKVKVIDKEGKLSVYNDGDKVRLKCIWLGSKRKSNYGQFNYITYNRANNIVAVAVVENTELIGYNNDIYSVRGNIIRVLDKKSSMLTDIEPRLLLGLFTGIKDGIDEDKLNMFAVTATIHLLTVSGFHFALVFLVSDKLLKLIRLPRNLRLVLDMVFMIGYFFITTMKFSCLRALLMILIFIISKLSCNKFDFLTSLSFVVIVTVLINPYGITDPSFKMTYLACIGIGLIYEVIKDKLDIDNYRLKILRSLVGSVILTVSIQISTSVYQSMNGGYLNLLSPIFNIIISLMVSALMYTSLVGYTASFIKINPIMSLINKVINIMESVLFITVGEFSKLQMCIVDIASIKAVILAGFAFFVVLLYLKISYKKFSNINVFILPIIVMIIVTSVGYFNQNELIIIFNDVGQGDSEMILTEHGKSIVIDTGDGKTDIASLLRYHGKDVVDYMILSHGHEDHMGGAEDLLTKLEVKNIIIPVHMKDQISEMIKLLNLEDTKVIVIDKITEVKCDNTKITVIPTYSLDENLNNCSLVVSVETENLKILYTGDIESEIETLLIGEENIKDCDILKVPHHGSDTSSTHTFINDVNPKVGVIEVGENTYSHPNRGVIEKYESLGTRILRTDQSGQMIFEYRNGSLKLKSFFINSLKLHK